MARPPHRLSHARARHAAVHTVVERRGLLRATPLPARRNRLEAIRGLAPSLSQFSVLTAAGPLPLSFPDSTPARAILPLLSVPDRTNRVSHAGLAPSILLYGIARMRGPGVEAPPWRGRDSIVTYTLL